MNKVGDKGKGESVWLGFFLYDILLQFSALAENYGDNTFAIRCRTEAATLQDNIEQNAWDGDWYLRAFFDDGTPLGSKINTECSIDSLSQSWSVISGAGERTRSVRAMESVYQKLVRHDKALVQLLDPPFDKSNLNPGYIKGYIPGVRENGGQYTHAAIWTAMAFSELGDIQKAWEVLNLINPIDHAKSSSGVSVYKVEPYVIAADVYSLPPHTGRGGWTWYTGSAGWMYRLIVESLLGIRTEGDHLFIEPCIPPEWQSFKIDYRVGQSTYHITVKKASDSIRQPSLTIDGTMTGENFIRISDDQTDHWIDVTLPAGMPKKKSQ
jgi:cellobiose phosphorylase